MKKRMATPLVVRLIDPANDEVHVSICHQHVPHVARRGQHDDGADIVSPQSLPTTASFLAARLLFCYADDPHPIRAASASWSTLSEGCANVCYQR